MVLGLCLLAAGCTSDSSETADPEVTPDPTTVSPAGTSVSGAAKGSTTAVSFTALMAYLPDAPAGWTAEEGTGASWTLDEGQWTWATREYEKGDARATILIQDSAYQEVGYWESWDSLVAFESSEGYYKSGTVSGHPSWEYFTKPASYGNWIGVNERFMVFVSIEDGSKQDLDTFVNAINYGSLANLK